MKVKSHTRRVRGKTIKVKGHERKGRGKSHKVGHRRRKHRAPHEKHMKSKGFRHKLRNMMKTVHRLAGTRKRRRR